jgi:hypothetical protein
LQYLMNNTLIRSFTFFDTPAAIARTAASSNDSSNIWFHCAPSNAMATNVIAAVLWDLPLFKTHWVGFREWVKIFCQCLPTGSAHCGGSFDISLCIGVLIWYSVSTSCILLLSTEILLNLILCHCSFASRPCSALTYFSIILARLAATLSLFIPCNEGNT